MGLFRKPDITPKLQAVREMLKLAKQLAEQKREAEALQKSIEAANAAASLGQAADDLRYAAIYSIASLHLKAKRYDEALAALDTATEIITANKWNYSLKHFEVMFYTSKVLFGQGNPTGAINLLLHANEQLMPRANTRDLYRCLALVRDNLASIYLRQNQLAEARYWLDISDQFGQQLGQFFPFVWSRTFYAMVQLWTKQGSPVHDLDRLRQAALRIERKVGTDHASLGLVRAAIATALEQVGSFDEAGALFETARQQLRLESGTLAQKLVWNGLGLAQLRKKNYSEAEAMFRNYLEMSGNGVDESERHIALNNLGVALREQGKLAEADSLFRQAIAIIEARQPIDLYHLANAMKNLAQNDQAAGNIAPALAGYEAALHRFSQASQMDARVKQKTTETNDLLENLRSNQGDA